MKGYELLGELCEIGPRLSGSGNSLKAIYWARDKMNEMKFDTVWLQPVMVPKWERGKVETAQIAYPGIMSGKKLNIASLGGSIGTGEKGITAGVIEVRNFEELRNRKDGAKGKIVFFNRPFDNTFVQTFRAYGDAVNQRFAGAVEAAKAGAVGALVRSITSKYDNVPHVGVMFYADSVKKIPAAAIGLEDADLLSNVIKENPGVKINIKMDCSNNGEVLSYNVIGEIKGNEYPEEIITLGGHFDSWDKGCGAHDDGAPCIQTMEVLDIFNRLNIKPKRTIRCVLFINEENGSRGAKAYADSAESKNENHLAAIESDRGAFTPRGFTVETDSVTLSKMQMWLPVLNKSLIDWIRPGGSGVDVSKIKNAKALFGYFPDNQRYFDFHHSANDTFEAVNPREMELGSAAMAILTYLISEEGL